MGLDWRFGEGQAGLYMGLCMGGAWHGAWVVVWWWLEKIAWVPDYLDW